MTTFHTPAEPNTLVVLCLKFDGYGAGRILYKGTESNTGSCIKKEKLLSGECERRGESGNCKADTKIKAKCSNDPLRESQTYSPNMAVLITHNQ